MILEADKVLVRDWKEADLEVFKSFHQGKHRWMDFNGPYYPQKSTSELQSLLKDLHERIIENEWPKLRERLVIAEQLSDKLIGTVNWYWQSEETNWMSIGIAIYDETYWNRGVGEQALRLWVNYLFEVNQSLVRLDFRTWSGNQGMIGLGKKLGFKEEARFRKARIVDGQYYDGIAMGVLKAEWIRDL